MNYVRAFERDQILQSFSKLTFSRIISKSTQTLCVLKKIFTLQQKMITT